MSEPQKPTNPPSPAPKPVIAKPAAPAVKVGTFSVIAEKCVSCTACWRQFPNIFEEKDSKAVAKAAQKIEKNHPSAVVYSCPTDAIAYSMELPPLIGATGLLQEVAGWENAWSARAHEADSEQERNRRYGQIYSVEKDEEQELSRVKIEFPTKVPNTRDKYRFGLPEKMPRYATKVTQEGNRLVVRAWLTDARIRKALSSGSAFPDRFSVAIEFSEPVVGFTDHLDGHNLMEIAVFHNEEAKKNFRWRSHFITEACVGCTICERVCPTRAISGDRKEIFYIDPKLCINCSVCGIFCPYDAINDDKNVLVPRIKAKEIPKAHVIDDLCTGCEFCVDVCPFDCIHMELAPDGFNRLARVDEQPCVSCKLCEQVCIKGAIVVDRPQDFPAATGFSFQQGA